MMAFSGFFSRNPANFGRGKTNAASIACSFHITPRYEYVSLLCTSFPGSPPWCLLGAVSYAAHVTCCCSGWVHPFTLESSTSTSLLLRPDPSCFFAGLRWLSLAGESIVGNGRTNWFHPWERMHLRLPLQSFVTSGLDSKCLDRT